MKRHTILSFSFVLVLCLSVAPIAMAASAEEEVLQVMTNFTKAANSSDLELMSSLYWHSPKTTVFQPVTGYPFLYQGWEQVEIWWKDSLGSPKGTIVLSTYHPQVTMLGDNAAVITYYQNTTINPPLAKEQTVSQYRVTWVVQKIGGKWLIVHGHASALPVG
jgi:uncharacterized protein (TIGR02246 family)